MKTKRLRAEAFWIPADKTLETTDFVIYDREHKRKGRELSKDKDGKYLEGWFFGNYQCFPARDMPDWAKRDVTIQG